MFGDRLSDVQMEQKLQDFELDQLSGVQMEQKIQDFESDQLLD